jgi:hypothetical protein
VAVEQVDERLLFGDERIDGGRRHREEPLLRDVDRVDDPEILGRRHRHGAQRGMFRLDTELHWTPLGADHGALRDLTSRDVPRIRRWRVSAGWIPRLE